MAHSARTLRIVGASVVALLMVGGAYALSGPIPFLSPGLVSAQTSAELLRAYAAKDSDQDGLMDWQEDLYNTDPYNAESFKEGVKDGDAVAQGLIEPKVIVAESDAPTDPDSAPGVAAAPNTITEKFAQTLFKQYMTARGENPPSAEEIARFVEDGVASLADSSASPDAYDPSDVKRSGIGGPDAVRTYLAEVERAFGENTIVSDKNELSYFSDAINDDKTALPHIGKISDAYRNIARAMMKISVPNNMDASHLLIANALIHMSEVNADMASMNEDPIRALMGIGLYEEYANRLMTAFASLNSVLEAQQVTVQQGVPGYFVANRAKVTAELQAKKDAAQQ